ncbi:MAG: bifunctional homocysteine S-methyltransferase/methylenetetrahydrofolate reductase [Gemmatimonadota bacterium]|nr:MAG: bifunctional homocysteine S-methyltransferase/methylenetetrahydrofolate reductase [Gemmatimonadota bacterium]
MTNKLRDLIADGNVHVLDGAMGTMLYSKGVFVNVCYDELNLTDSDLVQEVHERYVRAGAEIIETNTFGANPVKLSAFNLDDRTEEVNRAAAEIAQKASRDRASVVGAIGPLGIRIEPWGPTSRDEAVAFFERQVQGLLEGGVDGFMLETFADVDELQAAFRAVRKLTDRPIFAQMSFGEDGLTSYGTSVETATRQITEWGADVVGLNCSVGPAAMLDAIERMTLVTHLPISALPNAGLPRDVGNRKIYLAAPEYMARYARRMVEAGVTFVGGCCGTTPDHTEKIAEFVAVAQPRKTPVYVSRDAVAPERGLDPVPLKHRSRWGRKIATGEFVQSVEILPPRGWQIAEMLEKCRALKIAGVDAVNILDAPRSQSRMGALASAIIVEREVGIETVVHYTCRDRNMLGMISDLLGAAAAGLRNLLIVTGDPPRLGTYDFTGVFDIDSIGLTNVVYHLNHGLDPGGNTVGEATPYVIGVAVNHNASDPERELKRFYWKVDAGAEFAVTQPVFEPRQFEEFLKLTEEYGIPILAGIWPLRSLRNAEFLANEVPDVVVPESVLERMRKANEQGDEAAAAEGVMIAREVMQEIGDAVQGVQLTGSSGQVQRALEVLGR